MTTWVLSLAVERTSQDEVEDRLTSLGGAIVSSGANAEGLIPLDVYLAEEPDRDALSELLGGAHFTLEPLEDRDWVAESQAALPPITAGRFYVYGSHVADPPPSSKIPLLIEANIAFGTGRHETTHGCLLAITALDKRGGVDGAILDLGCGSGILAMAMAALWRRPIVATDLDAPSVRVAKENAKLNGLGRYLRAGVADGYHSRLIQREGPYGLIVANILAQPLCDLATDLRNNLRPGGLAILSGLLVSQERMVLGRHRAVGLKLVQRWRLGDWSVLLLRRQAALRASPSWLAAGATWKSSAASLPALVNSTTG